MAWHQAFTWTNDNLFIEFRMYLRMNSINFVLQVPGAKALSDALLFHEGATILWQFVDRFEGTTIR